MFSDQSTIRHALRHATDAAHDALDGTLGRLDLADRDSYEAFLEIQHAARGPIERWVSENAPRSLRPPLQTPLIEQDLRAMGRTILPATPCAFAATAAGALGVAWAIGGSSLGNRMMLGRLRKRSPDFPAAFLSDGAMPAFFAGLRPRLESAAREEAAFDASVAAAAAVFALFVRAADAVFSLERAA